MENYGTEGKENRTRTPTGSRKFVYNKVLSHWKLLHRQMKRLLLT